MGRDSLKERAPKRFSECYKDPNLVQNMENVWPAKKFDTELVMSRYKTECVESPVSSDEENSEDSLDAESSEEEDRNVQSSHQTGDSGDSITGIGHEPTKESVANVFSPETAESKRMSVLQVKHMKNEMKQQMLALMEINATPVGSPLGAANVTVTMD